MELAARIVLVLAYPLLLAARFASALLGRDPLRLREPKSASCWIERPVEPSRASYFSEASELEGRGNGGLGRPVAALLAGASAFLAPKRASSDEDFTAAAERDKDIPDEVYTLW